MNLEAFYWKYKNQQFSQFGYDLGNPPATVFLTRNIGDSTIKGFELNTDLKPARNTLRVVQGHDHPWLLSHALHAADASWVAGLPPPPGRYAAKSRYRQADAACALQATSPGAFALAFDAPQWSVTPGQSAVLYDGDVCLGGGVIDTAP